MTDWKVTVHGGAMIEISHKNHGHYGFHAHDLSIEDRLKMIHALSITHEDMMKEMFGDGDGKHGRCKQ